jgi:hypothetical protein
MVRRPGPSTSTTLELSRGSLCAERLKNGWLAPERWRAARVSGMVLVPAAMSSIRFRYTWNMSLCR